LLIDHQHTFATSSADIGYCSILQHDIDTGDAHPIRQAPRKPPLAAREAQDQILNEMLKTGVIEPSMSSWASPVCLAGKRITLFGSVSTTDMSTQFLKRMLILSQTFRMLWTT